MISGLTTVAGAIGGSPLTGDASLTLIIPGVTLTAHGAANLQASLQRMFLPSSTYSPENFGEALGASIWGPNSDMATIMRGVDFGFSLASSVRITQLGLIYSAGNPLDLANRTGGVIIDLTAWGLNEPAAQ